VGPKQEKLLDQQRKVAWGDMREKVAKLRHMQFLKDAEKRRTVEYAEQARRNREALREMQGGRGDRHRFDDEKEIMDMGITFDYNGKVMLINEKPEDNMVFVKARARVDKDIKTEKTPAMK
jgi:hypothetical protein